MIHRGWVYKLSATTLIFSLMLGCNFITGVGGIASPAPQPAAGRSPSSEAGGSLKLAVPANLEASPEAAAAALMDPNRVEEGVWFLLRGLGIGIYSGDGTQILAGSETGPNDFWLYDFEVPMLVRLAGESAQPFSDFQPLLAKLGLKDDQAGTLKKFKDIYAANPGAYLVRLFAAMGLRFEGDPQISPLQEWLVLLDTFVPPNPAPKTSQGQPMFVGLAGLRLLPHPLQQSFCGTVWGGTFTPNWGLVRSELATVNELIEVGNAYYAIHGPLLARSVKAELRPNRGSAHEGHDAPGGSITFSVTLKLDYGGTDTFIGSPSCGTIINLDRGLYPAALSGTKVWWKIISAFRNHGTFKDDRGHAFDGSAPTETDPAGKTSITFQARQEPANGQGQVKSIKANIRASFDPRLAIQALGLTEPRLLQYLPEAIDITSPENVTLEWHELGKWKVDSDHWMNSGGGYHLTGLVCNGLDHPFILKAVGDLAGASATGEFTFTPNPQASANGESGGTWIYAGSMEGGKYGASSTFQVEGLAGDVPVILLNPGSNWTITFPVVGTVPLGESIHLGVEVERITLEPATNECGQP